MEQQSGLPGRIFGGRMAIYCAQSGEQTILNASQITNAHFHISLFIPSIYISSYIKLRISTISVPDPKSHTP